VTGSAFQVRNLSKVFKVWKRPSDMLVEQLTARQRHAEFRALDDVSFDMPAGSVMGILGRNGAGKSTLLRLIAGTLEPTSGQVISDGRVAAILELGTGFHPDYSGRENVFLGGLCLGLNRQQVARRFDEIVEFAELTDVIDQPFRTYSSGMQARLTFAVATSVDADILIVDEALSVGDARFALKSFDRIQAFRRQGKAILLVSHDINTVNSFCDRAILLERGRLIASGEPKEVGNIYHELLFGGDGGAAARPQRRPAASVAAVPEDLADEPVVDEAETVMLNGVDEDLAAVSDAEHRYGDGHGLIVDFHIRDGAGRKVTRLEPLAEYLFQIEVEAVEEVRDICMGVLVRTPRGAELYGIDSIGQGGVVARLLPGERVVYKATFRNNLAPGKYFATASLARIDGLKHDLRFDALEFAVDPAPGVYSASLVNLELTFNHMIHGALPREEASPL
jgi:lipopolysaccharide transport system ATP-binding protein